MRVLSLLTTTATPLRAQLAVLGGIAFFALYWLVDTGYYRLPERAFLLTLCFAAVSSFGALAMAGPLSVLRALGVSLALGAGVTGLMFSAQFEVSNPNVVFDLPANAVALLVLSTITLPFLIAWHIRSPFDYETLFNAAWGIVVRGAAGGVFVGVYWLTLWLSHTLLQLVGVDVLEVLIETEWLAMTVSGAVLGFALAVVNELSDVISHHLILRLLRLVLPPLAVVAVVFLGAALINGVEDVFRGFSATVTLLSMAGVSALLITSALAEAEAEAASHPLILRAAQVLALSLPVMAGLAAWAVWLRVEQHGLTPERVAAGIVVIWVLGYGILYAGAVVRGVRWKNLIRRANIVMALAGLALSALWLSPAINANAVSITNQLARFQDGRLEVAELPLWEIAHEWGPTGPAALASLRAQAAENAELERRLARLDQAEGKWEFTTNTLNTDQDVLDRFGPLLAEFAVPEDVLLRTNARNRERIAELCLQGDCVAVAHDGGWLFLGAGEGWSSLRAYQMTPFQNTQWVLSDRDVRGVDLKRLQNNMPQMQRAAREGGMVASTATVPALKIGDNILILTD